VCILMTAYVRRTGRAGDEERRGRLHGRGGCRSRIGVCASGGPAAADLGRWKRGLRQQVEKKFAWKKSSAQRRRMKEILELVQQVAPTRATVLIHGESGTGKELIPGHSHVSPRPKRLW